MRTITITAMHRPMLFRQMLEGLSANDLDGWRIVIQVEPSPVAAEFREIAASVLGSADWQLRVNDQVLGVRDNPYHLLDSVFAQGSNLNIYLEEDLLLAPDVTALARWYEQNYQPHWLCQSLLSGGCGSAGMLSDADYPELLFEAKTFNSLGFVLRAQEWRRLVRPVWRKERARVNSHNGNRVGGWDWCVYGKIVTDPELVAVQPVLARANHNGPQGRYCKPDFHERAFVDLPLHDQSAPNYRLVTTQQLPRRVASHAFLADEKAQALMQLAKFDRRGRGGFVQAFRRLTGR